MAFGFSLSAPAPRTGLSAALQLDFVNSGTLDSRITFTRASSGTHFDSTGRLVTDGNNVARFDYDPAVPNGTVGPQLVTNGDFSQGSTGWTVTAPWSIANGFATSTGTSDSLRDSPSTYTTGKTYQITYTKVGAGNMTVYLRSTPSATTTATGTITLTLVAGTSGSRGVEFYASNGVSITNISVREVAFTPKGLLIEEARTNVVLHSRDMTNAWWSTKTDLTIERNQVGIDGTANSACRLTEGTANSAVLLSTTTVAAGSVITQSCYVEAVSGLAWVRIAPGEQTGTDFATAWFNLATGTKGAVSAAGAATQVTSSITPIGGGWYRISCSVLPNGTYTVARFVWAPCTGDGQSTRPGNSVMLMDCAQVEVGAFATSPIITTTATVTRAADVAQMTGANFSSWYNQTQGTFVGEFTRFGFDGVAGSVVVLQADDNTANNRVALRASPRTASAAPQGTIVVGGVVGANDSSTPQDITGTSQKWGFAYQVGVGAVTRNGQAPLNLTSVASLPTVTQFQIGTGGAAVPLNGHIRSIRYYNTRLPNATLQALTA